MNSELTPQERMAWLNGLASGALGGMLTNAKSMDAMDLGKFPAVDDGVMLETAALLIGAVLEGNPGYADPKRFGKAADDARTLILRHMRVLREMSANAGEPMLHKLLKVAGATATAPPANTN